MENNELQPYLNSLESKISLLLERYVEMKQELLELQEENQQLRGKIQSQEQTLKDFQYQEEISKIVNSVMIESGDPKVLRERIDQYIKEIDVCINFFSREL